MSAIRNMPAAGLVVIVVILALFALSLLLLFHVCLRYRALTRKAAVRDDASGFKAMLMAEYTAAYKEYGQEVNTPAIISDTVAARLSGLLFCERYLNNAVSLFVTLGLFGTFLGLSLSVSSLTELISYSNSSEWLSVLDSVGGGLMSALSGMGVAFYTSLVGAGCSILLTVLRTIVNPQAERERMETRLEMWLDTEVAPTLRTDAATNDAGLVKRMINALNDAVDDIHKTLLTAAQGYANATKASADALEQAVNQNKGMMEHFDESVGRFNEGVHDFSEVDYNLRGSVERMDLAVRDLAGAMRELRRRAEGGSQQ